MPEPRPSPSELASSEALLRAVLDSATSGIMVIRPVRDAAGAIVDFAFALANPRSEALTGLTADALLGHRLLELFPGNAISGLFDMYVRVMETGAPGRIETLYRDGRLDFWLDVSAVRVEDGLVVTFNDVSAHKRAELALLERSAELARQKAFAERVIENVMTGICYFDRELVFRLVNRTYCRLMDRPAEALLGRQAYEVVPGSESTTLPLFRAVLDRGEVQAFKAVPFTTRAADGTKQVTYWDATYLPMRPPDGGPIEGILVICDEVSDRMENERLQAERIEVLEAANRHKSQFLSILSHELRTPINAIMGFASILEDELPGELNAQQHLCTARILDGTDRMLALIDDLLDMSRIQAGRFAITKGRVDLRAVVTETIGALRPLADEKGLRIALEDGAPVADVPADAQRIGQVLTNLLGNAMKFTPEGGAIAVRVGTDGGDARVEVEDTGIGVAPEEQDRIFDAFTQVDMSNTRRAGGTGLGLAIARSLIEAHGGRIGVRSAAGQGATFWFTLPLST